MRERWHEEQIKRPLAEKRRLLQMVQWNDIKAQRTGKQKQMKARELMMGTASWGGNCSTARRTAQRVRICQAPF
jgi:hypothetical protein